MSASVSLVEDGKPGYLVPAGIRSTRPGFAALMRSHAAAGHGTLPAPAIAESTPRALIAPEFDAAYYLDSNEDVRLSGMDPFEHFLMHGAAELRNPNAWFDTGFYVRSNADVVDAEVNPFWHYLAHGKAEGRQPASRRQAERLVLAQAVPAPARWVGTPPDGHPQAPEALRAMIADRLASTAGLTVSVSHDRYTHSVGGVQILVADEQAAFNSRNETYLHIAPAIPRLMLAPPGDELPIHITIDGAYCGLTTYADLAQVLAGLAPVMPAARRFVVHCLLGHQIDFLIALHSALGPAAAVFWVNDYEAVCVGYNLLRNDVAFCGGPAPGSMACRVCVYGEDRDEHLAQVARLFAAIPFHVVAPSQAALAVWAAAARLPHASVQVHEYARVRPGVARHGLIGASPRGTPDNPVRVGFVGFAAPNKGWPAYAQIADALGGHESYRLFHFTALAADPPLPGVETVLTKVSANARGAMTDALIAASIDLVLVLSPWPETFCLVAYEAIAAGADVVTLPESGNVADMVLARGRGLVMPDTVAILEFFISEAAIAYVRMCGDQGSDMGRLESRGMTATLAIPDAPLGTASAA
jgi:glycosyltransferase involved in cell wall biosynthesis